MSPWQIFSPYGRVEDVYLMRDELKQSRGVSSSPIILKNVIFVILSVEGFFYYTIISQIDFLDNQIACLTNSH